MKKKKQDRKCVHVWNTRMLCSNNDKYLYHLCIKCGHTQRAKLIFRDYSA